MKKLFALLAILALLLCACGQKEEAQVQAPETTVPVTTAAPTTEPTTEPTTVPTEPPQPWRDNVMMENNPWAGPGYNPRIFGSTRKQDSITAVTFLDTLADAPKDAWDISMEQNGSVMAWVDTTDGRHLYIAGEGGVMAPGDCSWIFGNWTKLKEINFNGNFHTDDVWCFEGIFWGCTSLTSLDISTLNTSNATLMGGMFGYCDNLTELNITGMDTSKAEDLSSMFNSCVLLEELDLTHFDTSNVTTMEEMFKNCSALQDLKISSWDTSNVTNMCRMFDGLAAMEELDLNTWDVSNVTNMEEMFFCCHSLKKLNVSSWNTSKVTNMRRMFRDTPVTELAVEDWDVSNVVDMNSLFKGVHLTSLDLSKWDTSKVENMDEMIFALPLLETLELGEWEVDSIKTYKNFLGGDRMYKGEHYNKLFQK